MISKDNLETRGIIAYTIGMIGGFSHESKPTLSEEIDKIIDGYNNIGG